MSEFDLIDIFLWMQTTEHPEYARLKKELEDYTKYPRPLTSREVLVRVMTAEERLKWSAAMRVTGWGK